MYTGIVQRKVQVAEIDQQPGLMTFRLPFDASLSESLETGASVAVNGCCFTVTEIQDGLVSFDAIEATLALTNISELSEGAWVNVERSAKADVEVGGHVLSGHIVGTAIIEQIASTTNNKKLTLRGDASWMKYVFDKGFLAVNGCSLTVASIDRERSLFTINLIPETLARTNFSLPACGDRVNIEIESQTQVIVETVERVMAERYGSQLPA